MPTFVHSNNTVLPLTALEIQQLWQATITYRAWPDDTVGIACVTVAMMQQLNAKYRQQDRPTNILTFSYEGEHDIVLCFAVAEQEARERSVLIRNYVALLLVHAFIHATNLDHDHSAADQQEAQQAEREILLRCGFPVFDL